MTTRLTNVFCLFGFLLCFILSGCTTKGDTPHIELASLHRVSSIALQVNRIHNAGVTEGITLRAWWTDVWKDAQGNESSLDCVTLPVVEIPRCDFNKENEFFIVEKRDAPSDYFHYLKGQEWCKEELYCGLLMRCKVVHFSEETIHLQGVISRLGFRDYSYVWPFDVIIPYGKHAKIWEAQRVPDAYEVKLWQERGF